MSHSQQHALHLGDTPTTPERGVPQFKSDGRALLGVRSPTRVHRTDPPFDITIVRTVLRLLVGDPAAPHHGASRRDGEPETTRNRRVRFRQDEVVARPRSDAPLSPSMNEGPVSSPLVLRRDRACLREVVARRHGCRWSPGRMGCWRSLGGAGGVAVGAVLISLSLHQLRGPGVIGARSGGATQKWTVRQSGDTGACRSEGGPDGWLRVSMDQIASGVSFLASSIWATFAAAGGPGGAGALVALLVERVRGRRDRGLHQSPAQISGPCFESGPRRSISPDWLTRGHRPCIRSA